MKVTRLYAKLLPGDLNWRGEPINYDIQLTNDPTDRRITGSFMNMFPDLWIESTVRFRNLGCENADGSKVVINPSLDDADGDLPGMFLLVRSIGKFDLSNAYIVAGTSCNSMFRAAKMNEFLLPEKDFYSSAVTDFGMMFDEFKVDNGDFNISCLDTSSGVNFHRFLYDAECRNGTFKHCLDTRNGVNFSSMFGFACVLPTRLELLSDRGYPDPLIYPQNMLDVSSITLDKAENISDMFGGMYQASHGHGTFALMLNNVESLYELWTSDYVFAGYDGHYIFVDPEYGNWLELIDPSKRGAWTEEHEWTEIGWFDEALYLPHYRDGSTIVNAYIDNPDEGLVKGKFSKYEQIPRDLHLYVETGADGKKTVVITNDEVDSITWPTIEGYPSRHVSIATFAREQHGFNITSKMDLVFRNSDGSIVNGINDVFDLRSLLDNLDVNTLYFENVNISHFDNVNRMFSLIGHAKELIVRDIYASSAKTGTAVFASTNADKITINNFQAPKLRSASNMFYNTSAKEIYVNRISLSRAVSYENMFKDNTTAETIVAKGLTSRYIENFDSMFENCPRLRKLDLQGFNSPIGMHATTSRMFYGDTKLTSIYIDPNYPDWFESSHEPTCEDMFYGCVGLQRKYRKARMQFDEDNQIKFAHSKDVERGDWYFDYEDPGEPRYGVFIPVKRDNTRDISDSMLLPWYNTEGTWKEVFPFMKDSEGWHESDTYKIDWRRS